MADIGDGGLAHGASPIRDGIAAAEPYSTEPGTVQEASRQGLSR